MKFPHTVTRLRAEVVVGYGGQQVRDWGDAARVAMPANVQPETQSELTENRQTTVTGWSLFLPPGSSLLATDRVLHDGMTLEVDGDVEDWTRGDRGHIKARLVKVSDA